LAEEKPEADVSKMLAGVEELNGRAHWILTLRLVAIYGTLNRKAPIATNQQKLVEH
jgi:hypothetical protein